MLEILDFYNKTCYSSNGSRLGHSNQTVQSTCREVERKEAEMAKDLQKEFHAARKAGSVAAIEFLLENYEQNPRFAANRLAKLCSDDRLDTAQAAEKLAQRNVDDASWLWYAYQEFSRLSERQKTKRGGFKGFVRTRAGEDVALFERVERLTERSDPEWEGSPYGAYCRTYRTNYKRHHEYCCRQLAQRQAYYDGLRRGAAALEQQAA